MKTFLAILFVIFLSSQSILAQAIEVSGYGGYMMSGKSRYYNGEIDVFNGAVYGATIGYEGAGGSDTQIQFLYNTSTVDAETIEYQYGSPDYLRFSMKIEHFHVGLERQIAGNELIRPYGAFALGLTSYSPKQEFDQVIRFSGSLGAGIKIFPIPSLGFKLQAKMFLPMVFDGAGIYCSSGNGCGGGSSFRVPIVHGELSGGVVFRLER